MLKSISAILLAAPVACVTALCLPGTTHAETLPDALATAIAESPLLRSQRAQVDAMGEDHVQARSAFGPTVQIGAQSTASNQASQSGDTAVQLSVNQPLFYSGRIANASRATKADAQAGKQRLRAAENSLLAQVANAYANVQRDEAILALADEQIGLLEGQAAEVEARRAVSQVTKTDVDQVKMRQAAARGARAQAQAQLDASRADYANLVGHRPATLAPLPGVRSFASIDEAVFAAEDSSPTLAAARLDQQGTRARVAAARSEYGPSIGLRGTVGYEQVWQYGYQQSVRADSVSVVISQPLFTSGLNRSRVRQAQDRNSSAENLIENTRRELRRDVEQAFGGVTAAKARLATGMDRVAGSRSAYEGMRIEFRGGLRTTIDVLNAAQELNAAETDLAAAKRDTFMAEVRLLQAVGVLSQVSFTDAPVSKTAISTPQAAMPLTPPPSVPPAQVSAAPAARPTAQVVAPTPAARASSGQIPMPDLPGAASPAPTLRLMPGLVRTPSARARTAVVHMPSAVQSQILASLAPAKKAAAPVAVATPAADTPSVAVIADQPPPPRKGITLAEVLPGAPVATAPPAPQKVASAAPRDAILRGVETPASARPAAPVQTAPVQASTPARVRGRFDVQIGAFESAETAQAALDAVSKARGGAVAGKPGVIQEARVNGRVWRRAVFTGFTDEASAAAACQAIGDAAKGCFTRKAVTALAAAD